MSEEKFEQFLDDYRLLIEAGFSAVKLCDETAAHRLFCAAEVLRSDAPEWALGLGYIALNKLEVKKAAQIFKEVLEQHPDYHIAQTFYGLALLFSKETRQEGERLIKDSMNKTDDPSVKNLGRVSLEFAETDLKKSKAPFFTGAE
ncbi:MAG: SctF chaperone SctG [Waddliaceae bacterium]|nr:SctF chaperone SctG [Waddliaceae bacterium]